MDPLEELKIEITRLRRHVDDLDVSFSMSVARDLAACLRNIVQMATSIDKIIIDHSLDVRFSKIVLPKTVKKIRSTGSSIFIPLPGSVSLPNVKISEVVIHDRALSPEEMRKSYEANMSSRPVEQKMTFTAWLEADGYQIRTKEGYTSISRKMFIIRAANLLGGTHPMSNFDKGDYETWADPYIIDLLDLKIGTWPAPYVVLMESAQQILEKFANLP